MRDPLSLSSPRADKFRSAQSARCLSDAHERVAKTRSNLRLDHAFVSPAYLSLIGARARARAIALCVAGQSVIPCLSDCTEAPASMVGQQG